MKEAAEKKQIETKLELLKEVEGRGLVRQSTVFYELRAHYMNILGEIASRDPDYLWYVGECDSDKTWEGQVFLHERGFPTFLPIEDKSLDEKGTRRLQRSGKKAMKKRFGPVRYGAIWFAMPKGEWRAKDLFSAPHTIWRVMNTAGKPHHTSGAVINQFIESNKGVFDPFCPALINQMKVGDKVRIIEGKFSGVITEISQMTKKAAWVGVIGPSRTKMPLDNLEKIT